MSHQSRFGLLATDREFNQRKGSSESIHLILEAIFYDLSLTGISMSQCQHKIGSVILNSA